MREVEKTLVLEVAFDDIQKSNRRINGYKIYHSTNINELLKNKKINQIIIAIADLNFTKRREIISKFNAFNVEILFFPSVFEIVENKINLKDFERVSVADILNRQINLDVKKIEKFIKSKKILITGAGGSIGEDCSWVLELAWS